MDLQELVSVTENLTDGCQKVLFETLREILYRQKGAAKVKPCDELGIFVEAGLLTMEDGRYNISEAAKKKSRKLYTYLLRKFDFDYYFDPEDGTEKKIPKGAEFVCTISMDGRSELKLQFPDDEITAMLNLFGTNRCDNWL